jgi:hypothetical protein
VSEFLTTLDVRLLPECPDVEQWQLLAPLSYQSDLLGTVTAPAGFILNFVSFSALNYTAHRPAGIHDFLYCCKDVTRDQADAVLKEALESICESRALIEAMYLAVRVFGGSHRSDADLIYTLKGE